MDTLLIKYAILAVVAAISGFFLIGFIIYSAYAAIQWLRKKTSGKEKIWGGLIGVGVNSLIFLLTFPAVFPVIMEAVEKVFVRFIK